MFASGVCVRGGGLPYGLVCLGEGVCLRYTSVVRVGHVRGRFVSGRGWVSERTARGYVHALGCVRGVLRVRVRCAGRRVRGVCGCACAGRGVCLRPAFGIAGCTRGVGVCFQPDMDFRFFHLRRYCNFRNTFPDFISAKY